MPNRSRDSAPVRAGVYTRISWDPAGQGAGVERQRLDCEADGGIAINLGRLLVATALGEEVLFRGVLFAVWRAKKTTLVSTTPQ